MIKHNVLLLGFTVPEKIAKEIFSLDPSPAVQTHKFAWCFARSLQSVFDKVFLASACPIQNYPLGRKLYFRGNKFEENGAEGISLGFINLLFIKHFTRFFSCLLFVPRFIKLHKVKIIFIHGIHTPFLLFGVLMHLFGKKIIVVMTDPPGVFLSTDGKLEKFLKKIDVKLVTWMLSHTDGVISLAPELVNHFSIKNPYLVFPGILDSTITNYLKTTTKKSTDKETFNIVYAGGLSKSYGIDRLLDAIIGINDTPVHIKFFGRGDQENRIKALAASDNRFEYGGFINKEQLLPELKKSDLLINPRPSNEAFSTMSFPSKLIEYLATGRPVLTTRIAGIPKDYRNHFLYINDESPDGIRHSILEVIGTSPFDRDAFALQAQDFIFSAASEISTGKKIAGLVNSIMKLN